MIKFATQRGCSPATTDPAKSRTGLCVIAAALLCVALTGCSKPTDAVVPTDPKQWDGEFAQKIKSLSEADKGLLAAYLLRTQLGEVLGKQGMPIGTTVGQAIDAQRQWMAEQDARKAAARRLKVELEAKQEATAAELSKTVVLTFLRQRYIPQNLDAGQIENRFSVQIGVKNLGSKAITRFIKNGRNKVRQHSQPLPFTTMTSSVNAKRHLFGNAHVTRGSSLDP